MHGSFPVPHEYNHNGPIVMAGPGIMITSSYPNTIVRADVTREDVVALQKRIDELEKKLCVLTANPEAMEKFESLKNAYEHYKIIEKLVYEHK